MTTTNTNTPPIINRVAQSGIITLNLEPFVQAITITPFDLKPYLFKEMILKEKDFRAALKAHDWSQYEAKNVAVFCSVDAIIPVWAYMLVASYLVPYAKSISQTTPAILQESLISKQLQQLPLADYTDKRVVIKGCGSIPIPPAAYVAVTAHLKPVVKSLMYGEPCSTVPIYKQPRPPKK